MRLLLKKYFGVLLFCYSIKEISSKPGEKLFLTPYLKKGDFKEGQKAAVVPPLVGDFKSYSGYFTVNERYGSNLFFWYFLCEDNPVGSPVVLWLSGGPGGSSLNGLVLESGPYNITENGNLTIREYRWTKYAHMLYIDQPVGTGFSYTNNTNGYAVNETMIADDMYEAITQFFSLFPNLSKNDFFIAGESYSGKYIPAIAYKIYQMKNDPKSKINLKGLVLGDPFLDPITIMPTYGKLFYQIGLIDKITLKEYEKRQNAIVNKINKKDYLSAHDLFDRLINGALNCYPTFFTNTTGYTFYYNYYFPTDPLEKIKVTDLFADEAIQRKIHVGKQSYLSLNTDVEIYLSADMLQSVKPLFEILLDNYRVVIYNGQFDAIVPYTSVEELMRTVRWSGADSYKNATRKVWMIGDYLAGYTKSAGNFTEILVRNAGHLVPIDQPLSVYSLIYQFVYNLPF